MWNNTIEYPAIIDTTKYYPCSKCSAVKDGSILCTTRPYWHISRISRPIIAIGITSV